MDNWIRTAHDCSLCYGAILSKCVITLSGGAIKLAGYCLWLNVSRLLVSSFGLRGSDIGTALGFLLGIAIWQCLTEIMSFVLQVLERYRTAKAAP